MHEPPTGIVARVAQPPGTTEKPEPVAEIAPSVIGFWPESVTVKACVALSPTSTVPASQLVGLSVAATYPAGFGTVRWMLVLVVLPEESVARAVSVSGPRSAKVGVYANSYGRVESSATCLPLISSATDFTPKS